MSDHKTYFDFGYHVEDLLFKGITVSSVGGMFGLCLGVSILTLLYEAVKVFRHRLLTVLRSRVQNAHENPLESPRSERAFLVTAGFSAQTLKRLKFHLMQTLLYVFQVILGYFLMLIIMSYNVWLAFTIFVTSGLSYYMFGVFVLSRSVVVPVEFLAADEQ